MNWPAFADAAIRIFDAVWAKGSLAVGVVLLGLILWRWGWPWQRREPKG